MVHEPRKIGTASEASRDAAATGAPRPVRRAFAPPGRSQRDRDAMDRVVVFRLLAWAPVGTFLGALGGAMAGHPVLGALAGTVLIPVVAFLAMRPAVAAAGTIYAPTGGPVRRRRSFSYPESLAARGHPREAVEAYLAMAAEDPRDLRPLLEAARLHRDALHEPEEALRLFRKALREGEPDPGTEGLVTREAVELLRGVLGRPSAAAPLLARLAERRRDTPEGRWAAEELREVRKGVVGEGDGT